MATGKGFEVEKRGLVQSTLGVLLKAVGSVASGAEGLCHPGSSVERL